MVLRGGLAALTLVTSCLLPSAARAVVIVNDTWKDDMRTDPAAPTYSENGTDVDGDGDIESVWYGGGVGTLAPTPGAPAGPLVGTTGSGSSSNWTTYFRAEGSEVNLANAGDALEVRWVFKPTGVDASNNTSTGLRIGVANTQAADRLTADGSPPVPASGGNYQAYAIFGNMGTTIKANPFDLRERTGATSEFLKTSSDWTSLASTGASGNPGYADGTTYTYTMTLTRNAGAGLDIVARMEGTGLGPSGQGFFNVAFTDATPSTFAFDMFSIRLQNTTQSASQFDTSLFRVQQLLGGGGGSENANFDGVGVTDGNDFLIWQRGLGVTGTGTLATGDANSDQNIDGTDLGIWRSKFGTAATGGGTNANLDGIGVADGSDFVIWQRGLGAAGTGTMATGDANGDQNVDTADLNAWRGQFGSAAVAAAGAVPEPSGMLCGLIAVVGLAGRRRRT